MKLKTIPVTFLVLAVFVTLMIGSALAQEKPCAGDVEKYCQGIQPGDRSVATDHG